MTNDDKRTEIKVGFGVKVDTVFGRVTGTNRRMAFFGVADEHGDEILTLIDAADCRKLARFLNKMARSMNK